MTVFVSTLFLEREEKERKIVRERKRYDFAPFFSISEQVEVD